MELFKLQSDFSNYRGFVTLNIERLKSFSKKSSPEVYKMAKDIEKRLEAIEKGERVKTTSLLTLTQNSKISKEEFREYD